MEFKFNLFKFQFKLNFECRTRYFYITHFYYVEEWEDKNDLAFDFCRSYTRLSAIYRTWSKARFLAWYERKSICYDIVRYENVLFQPVAKNPVSVRRGIFHQETRSVVSLFSKKTIR